VRQRDKSKVVTVHKKLRQSSAAALLTLPACLAAATEGLGTALWLGCTLLAYRKAGAAGSPGRSLPRPRRAASTAIGRSLLSRHDPPRCFHFVAARPQLLAVRRLVFSLSAQLPAAWCLRAAPPGVAN